MGPPPPCQCGCGEAVGEKRGKWQKYAKSSHTARGAKQSAEQRAATSARMRQSNPMKRKAVRVKVSATMKGRPAPYSAEHAKKLAEMSRERMLSGANPMKDPEIARKSFEARAATGVWTSKFELRFKNWADENGLPLAHTGKAKVWIAQRNPDFRVIGQKKCIELTQEMVFRHGQILRDVESYGVPSVKHYTSHRWQCLVIFLKATQRRTVELLEVIRDFASPESNWSGVWNYDRLIRYPESGGESKSSTSPASR